MLKFHKIPNGFSFFSPTILVASFGGSGFLKPASGTWGSLAALFLAFYILINFNPLILFISSITLYIIGIWACQSWLRHDNIQDNTQDPAAIVIDEAAGLWLTLALIPYPRDEAAAIITLLGGFIMFRLFDILKPWPISYCDKNIKGAHGIMLDDMVAGLFAALSLTLILKGLAYVF